MSIDKEALRADVKALMGDIYGSWQHEVAVEEVMRGNPKDWAKNIQSGLESLVEKYRKKTTDTATEPATETEPDPVPPAFDPVFSPQHYVAGRKIEPWAVIEDWELGFHLGNAVKYIARWQHKGGLEDLRKAQNYIRRFVEWQEGKAGEATKVDDPSPSAGGA